MTVARSLAELFIQMAEERAEAKAKKICGKVIRTCQSLKGSSMLSGDDTPLANVWDEVCVQVQGEESFYWGMYEDTIRGEIQSILDKTCDKYDRLMLWLQTDEGRELAFSYDEDAIDYFDKTGWPDPEDDYNEAIVNYLFQEVIGAADNYTNERIEKFLY